MGASRGGDAALLSEGQIEEVQAVLRFSDCRQCAAEAARIAREIVSFSIHVSAIKPAVADPNADLFRGT